MITTQQMRKPKPQEGHLQSRSTPLPHLPLLHGSLAFSLALEDNENQLGAKLGPNAGRTAHRCRGGLYGLSGSVFTYIKWLYSITQLEGGL